MASASTHTPIAAPIRCFLDEVPEQMTKACNNNVTFRLLGIIVMISTHETNQLDLYSSKLVLDDGTGTCCIFVTRSMLNRLNQNTSCSLQVGHVLECIVNKHMQAKQLVQISKQNAAAAQTLRWLELSYMRKQENGGVPNNYMGYPTICADQKKDSAFQIIWSQSPEQNNHNESSSSGIGLDDLALILGVKESDMQDLLDDLQETGMIYKNAKGLYVPL